MKIMIRLTTLVGLIVFSNFLVILMIIIWSINGASIDHESKSNLFAMFVPIVYLFDINVNCLCLLFQYGWNYQIYCKLCDKCWKSHRRGKT